MELRQYAIMIEPSSRSLQSQIGHQPARIIIFTIVVGMVYLRLSISCLYLNSVARQSKPLAILIGRINAWLGDTSGALISLPSTP